MGKMPVVTVFALIFALGGVSLWAQSQNTAQIQGTVQDASGSAVPGAEIRATQTDTGVTRTATTGAEGGYVLANLPVGPYRLEVVKQGFSTFVQTGIVLQVATNPTVDVSLKVGGVNEQIQVEANAAQVETEATGVGQVMENRRILELPLNGRLATDLIQLTPAVINQGVAGAGGFPNTGNVVVAGGQSNGVAYLSGRQSFQQPLGQREHAVSLSRRPAGIQSGHQCFDCAERDARGSFDHRCNKVRHQRISWRRVRFLPQWRSERAQFLCADAGYAEAQSIRRDHRRADSERQAVLLFRLPGHQNQAGSIIGERVCPHPCHAPGRFQRMPQRYSRSPRKPVHQQSNSPFAVRSGGLETGFGAARDHWPVRQHILRTGDEDQRRPVCGASRLSVEPEAVAVRALHHHCLLPAALFHFHAEQPPFDGPGRAQRPDAIDDCGRHLFVQSDYGECVPSRVEPGRDSA